MSFFEVYKSEIDHQDQRDSFFSLGKRDADSFITEETIDSEIYKHMESRTKKNTKINKEEYRQGGVILENHY